MTTKKATNPRGAGRKPSQGESMKSRTFRMTDAQHEKCERLGGADWVRRKIDAAKDPADK